MGKSLKTDSGRSSYVLVASGPGGKALKSLITHGGVGAGNSVALSRACHPTATFGPTSITPSTVSTVPPVVLFASALEPIAVLPVTVLLKRAFQPTAVLLSPVALLLSAW